MRKLLFTFLLTWIFGYTIVAQIKIGNNPQVIDPSALLELESTDKGIIIPRMTSTERQNILLPAEGLMVFDTWTQSFWYYNVNGWNEVAMTTVIVMNNTDHIIDSDLNTWVHTGQNGNDDTVRIVIAGMESYRFTSRSLDQINNGRSLFLGENAGLSDDGTDNENAFSGYRSGMYNITGSKNTALGAYSLFSNPGQDNLVAIGHSALRNNGIGAAQWWEGTENTAVGFQSQYQNTLGYNNTAIGYNTLYANTDGDHNTAVGGYSLTALNGGQFNSAFGAYAMFNMQGGYWNAVVGKDALYFSTNGNSNAVLGFQAMYLNTTSQNTAVGTWSLYNQSGGNNTAVGYYALYGNSGTGSGNVAVGYEALKSLTNGYRNVALGSNAMEFNTTGATNVAAGWLALGLNQAGNDNTALGTSALYNNFSGSDNTAIGSGAGPDVGNPGLNYTTALGRYALTTADNQVRIGHAGIASIGGYQNWSNISDGRYKNDLTENVPGLEFITQLRPVTYQLDVNKINHHLGIPDSVLKDDAFSRSSDQKSRIVQTGFIAQEVEQAAHSLGYDFSGVDTPKNDRDLYGLRYAEFVVPLVKAVQEQQAILEAQQISIQKLENELKRLSEKIEAIEK